MIELEKDFQEKFGNWAEKFGKMAVPKLTKAGASFVYELKISHGNTVAFSKFEDQQLPSLWKAYSAAKNVKLTDASYGIKPFDGFVACGIPAYVGIMFRIPLNQKEFYLIHIKEVMKIKSSGSKSIKKADCERVGMKFRF